MSGMCTGGEQDAPHSLILASRHDGLAIDTDGHAVHPLGVPQVGGGALPSGRVPQPGGWQEGDGCKQSFPLMPTTCYLFVAVHLLLPSGASAALRMILLSGAWHCGPVCGFAVHACV